MRSSADQSRRFDQIGLQQRGIEVFGDPEVQAKLMLTEEQFAKIGAIIAEGDTTASRRSPSIAGKDREGR